LVDEKKEKKKAIILIIASKIAWSCIFQDCAIQFGTFMVYTGLAFFVSQREAVSILASCWMETKL